MWLAILLVLAILLSVLYFRRVQERGASESAHEQSTAAVTG
jgi:hypothetical protein